MFQSPQDRQKLAAALDRAERYSPFLAQLIARERALVAKLAEGALPSPAVLRNTDDSLPFATRLRIERRRQALSVAIGDLAGVLNLSAVTRQLTDFADYALDAAIRAALIERAPGDEPRGLVGIALGKQGSRELNYSSDIDPLLLFDPATLPRRPREAPEEAAVRIGRRVIELLQARDADGYVLRVDLRLRPSPEVTPIVLPVEAAISHYESAALPWERAAFIRARVAAGDRPLGDYFLAAIRSFVWRRSLDFGAVRDIRSISQRIRDHHAQGQAFGPGYDLKRGRGGIRECEFFAQIHQLIHGGREPAVRAPATRDALAALSERGFIDAGDAAALIDAYTLLRTIEHRVQMIDDRQTHTLPAGEALDNVARLHGLEDGAGLLALLAPPVERTAAIYASLEPEAPAGLPIDRDRLVDAVAELGFGDHATLAADRIARWRGGTYPALRSATAQAALEAALPALAKALGAAPDPAGAVLRLDDMLAGLPSALNLFRLLEAQPGLAQLLGTILSHAPPLAEALGRRPALLDGLIDATALDPLGSVADLVAQLRPAEPLAYEALLDHLRAGVNERRFALGAQLVAASSDPLEIAGGYARLAEAAIEVAAAASVAEFAKRHGQVPGSELVVLALGRLGGGLLTHASDLDLVYLFTGDHLAESDGEKPLGAVLYYNRLAQRVSAALSVPTPAGALYEIDTRLRPSGAQGPLVVSLAGFAAYQRGEAWTWEHMALARARAVFGSPGARAAVAGEIAAVLGGARPGRDIAADARAMRAEIARHKPPAGPLDVKLLPGGLVDLEFAVHVTQLIHRTGFDPDLRNAIKRLAGEGLLPPTLGAAHDFFTRLLVAMRLIAPGGHLPGPASCALLAQVLQMSGCDQVVARVEALRQEIATLWHIIGKVEDGAH